MASSPPRPRRSSPEIRRDAVFNRCVIFSPTRARRPSDLKSHSPAVNPNPNPRSCPFCKGNERDCAPEIFRVPSEDGADWRIRVIENLYPALHRDVESRRNPNPSSEVSAIDGFGFHDVVIETPSHSVHLPDLSAAEVGEVVLAYKERIVQLARRGDVKYVQVFKNHGASAGASLSHSHSQIMGLPLVPPTVSSRLRGTKEWFDRTGKCSLCEAQSDEILIDKSTHFYSIVPFAGSSPFEIWIIPRHHTSYFHEIDDEKAMDLGGMLKLMLWKLARQLNDPPLNFMIHSAPFDLQASCSPHTHWFLQIVPQLTVIGGFEMGSGCYINPVFPEDAANILRDLDPPPV